MKKAAKVEPGARAPASAKPAERKVSKASKPHHRSNNLGKFLHPKKGAK